MIEISVPYTESQLSADAVEEYTPTQPNAIVNYNIDSTEITVTWDFNSIDPADSGRCAVKGDFYFSDDANIGPILSEDTITSFIPIKYSAHRK